MEHGHTDTIDSAATPDMLNLNNTDLVSAHKKYDGFVQIHLPILSVSEFKEKVGLSLNTECASVFYGRIVHLSDTDFVQIDRNILELIGFKNTVYEQKDKNGVVKLDKYGNPKLKDTRIDFANALRCLRNTSGFAEGSSFNDKTADFVIKKSERPFSGQNKQSLWIRVRALEHFVIMANTSNSYKIREFFLDLKRLMTEYLMYVTVYNSKYELSMKDTTIGHLNAKVDYVITQNDALLQQNSALFRQNEIQGKKLDLMSSLFYKDTDDKVLGVESKQKKQELAVLRNKNDPTQCEVVRGQVTHVNHQLKRKRNDMELVAKIDSYKNPINLYNRFGETIKREGDDRFTTNNNKITLKEGCTAEDLMNVFHTLNNDKHDVALRVRRLI